jgi:hypothetical protein
MNTENIKKTNVNLLYIVPQRRPYVIPQKRTEKEQKMFEIVKDVFKKKV